MKRTLPSSVSLLLAGVRRAGAASTHARRHGRRRLRWRAEKSAGRGETAEANLARARLVEALRRSAARRARWRKASPAARASASRARASTRRLPRRSVAGAVRQPQLERERRRDAPALLRERHLPAADRRRDVHDHDAARAERGATSSIFWGKNRAAYEAALGRSRAARGRRLHGAARPLRLRSPAPTYSSRGRTSSSSSRIASSKTARRSRRSPATGYAPASTRAWS